MAAKLPIAANILRIRLSRGLTQQQVADGAGLSRVAFREIEVGKTRDPRVGNLQNIAVALGVVLGELLAAPPSLASARFRAGKVRSKKDLACREEVVFQVATWLKDFGQIEEIIQDHKPWKLADVASRMPGLPAKDRPIQAAALARQALGLSDHEPIRDICGVMQAAGVKIMLIASQVKWFFGLSVAQGDGGPAVIVNRDSGITVERQIFSAAHELGHLLLHPGAYDVEKLAEDDQEEREADLFAGHFLMPQNAFGKQWSETRGLSFVDRILHAKRLFRVSYKTILHRLIEMKLVSDQIWQRFAVEYKRLYGGSLSGKVEPLPLTPMDFVEDRLSRMVRQALENQAISLSRAAEILRVDLHAMRERVASWNMAA